MAKLLFINQTFYPDVVATAQQLTDFCVYLVKEGHEVTVLAGQRGYSYPHAKHAAQETYKGVRVIRVCPFAFGRKYRFLRILDALFITASFGWTLLWLPKFDKTIAMTTPPLIAWIAAFMAQFRSGEFIYWIMDLNPDQAIEAGWIKKDSLTGKILNAMQGFLLKKSDKIVVLDRFMKDRIIAQGAPAPKIGIVPPWSLDEDLETIPHEENLFRKKHGLEDKFIVMYSGNHGICHSFETLLEACQELRNDPGVVFVFIGEGERVKEVLAYKEKHGLSNMIHMPYQSRDQLKYSLSAADLHIASMYSRFVGIVHPCKIYGILRIGRPLAYIGPSESHIGEMLSGTGLGYRVEQGDKKALLSAIENTRKMSGEARIKTRDLEQKLADRNSKDLLCRALSEFIFSPRQAKL